MCGLGGDGWAGEDEAEEGNACWLCIIWGGIHCVIVRGGGGGGSVLGRWCACWPEDGPVCVSCRSVWPSVPRRVLPWWYSVQCLCHTATAMSWVSLSAWGMHYHYVVACAAGRLRPCAVAWIITDTVNPYGRRVASCGPMSHVRTAGSGVSWSLRRRQLASAHGGAFCVNPNPATCANGP